MAVGKEGGDVSAAVGEAVVVGEGDGGVFVVVGEGGRGVSVVVGAVGRSVSVAGNDSGVSSFSGADACD